MLVYLDSLAIVKLIVREEGTRDLFTHLASWPHRVTSVIAEVEVRRAIRRAGATERALQRTSQVLDRLGRIELDAPIRSRAAGFEPFTLRTLDAVHLATALELGDDISHLVTYDERLGEATRRNGLDVVTPGID